MTDLTLADGTVVREREREGENPHGFTEFYNERGGLVTFDNLMHLLTAEVAAREKAERDVDDNADYMGKVRAEVEKIAGTKQSIDLYSLACDAAQFHEEAKRERDALAAQVEVLREALEVVFPLARYVQQREEHDGDCTNMPYTCIRCLADEALAHQPTEEARQ